MGIIEGITEFLPVSSTAHLILAGDLFGWRGEVAKTFEIFIQLGAILAVVWLYRVRVLRLLRCLWLREERALGTSILVSFVPAALMGLAFHPFIKRFLFTPEVVGAALVAGGVGILVIERVARPSVPEGVDRISLRTALGIGLAQCLSLIPGVSRSGATIMGAISLGVPRKSATEYSFLLAIPTMVAATLFELVSGRSGIQRQDYILFVLGFLGAFFSALFIVQGFLSFVQHHKFTSFAWYRICFGSVVLIYAAL